MIQNLSLFEVIALFITVMILGFLLGALAVMKFDRRHPKPPPTIQKPVAIVRRDGGTIHEGNMDEFLSNQIRLVPPEDLNQPNFYYFDPMDPRV